MPLEETDGLSLGDRIIARGGESTVDVSPQLLGRVLDGFGVPMDGGPPIHRDWKRDPLYAPPPNPMDREHITEQLITGIRAIDGLLPCGKGQRIGIFGGSGVGKSTLLGRHGAIQFSRRQRDCPDRRAQPRSAGVHRARSGAGRDEASVVVVATSDRPAPLRVRACFVALAVAEYFRDQGEDVLLVMDSITRLAMAQREIGLAAGEPPSQKGLYAVGIQPAAEDLRTRRELRTGSITAFFTVLVEGDDFNEPICDAVRAILDGHITLSRDLGSAGHYPAIQVLDSVSRLQSKLATPQESESAERFAKRWRCIGSRRI